MITKELHSSFLYNLSLSLLIHLIVFVLITNNIKFENRDIEIEPPHTQSVSLVMNSELLERSKQNETRAEETIKPLGTTVEPKKELATIITKVKKEPVKKMAEPLMHTPVLVTSLTKSSGAQDHNTKNNNTLENSTDFIPKTPSTEAVLLDQIKPEIPEELKQNEYSSSVRVKVIIESDGKPTASLKTSSGNTDIDSRVIIALNKWKWKPALLDGEAVASVRYFKFEFEVR